MESINKKFRILFFELLIFEIKFNERALLSKAGSAITSTR